MNDNENCNLSNVPVIYVKEEFSAHKNSNQSLRIKLVSADNSRSNDGQGQVRSNGSVASC